MSKCKKCGCEESLLVPYDGFYVCEYCGEFYCRGCHTRLDCITELDMKEINNKHSTMYWGGSDEN